MCNSKLYGSVYRNQYRVFFLAVPVMMFLLPLTSVQAVQEFDKELTGIVKKVPGVFSCPFGTWIVEDKEIRVTEETIIKGDQSEARFGTKVTVKGSRIDGFFTAYEIEIGTNDEPMVAGR